MDRTPRVFEKEFEVEYQADRNLPYTVERSDDGAFVVEGPRIEKMLGYTNLDSEKGFDFFQKFLKQNGILDELEKAESPRAIQCVCTVWLLSIINKEKSI